VNPVFLQNLDWLIQPEALRSMAAASRSFLDRGATLPQPSQSSPLLSVEDGIGVVAIDGPILRKPDIFARVLFRATDSNITDPTAQTLFWRKLTPEQQALILKHQA
jgi:hypothetical protein